MAEIFAFDEDFPTTTPSSDSLKTLTGTDESSLNVNKPNDMYTSQLTSALRFGSHHHQQQQQPQPNDGNEIDELCDTVAELNTSAFISSSPVRTRAVPITINNNSSNMVRGRSGSGSFQPGSADGRAGKSFEIGIKSPFVSSFADNANFKVGTAPESPVLSTSFHSSNDHTVIPSDASRKVHPWDFERLKVLGEGTYGKVLLVREKRSGRLFAQKQLKKASMIIEQKKILQTKTERDILESVRHPYIVKLFYAMQDQEKLYLILEYVQGGELFTYLANQSMLSEDTAAFYLAEMVLALHHLHVNVGVVYRDLKPENCLLDNDGHLVLTDFGLSKVATGDDDERCKTFLGTPEYMAPEILQGEEYDYAVDWWSLGAVAHDLLTGSPPFPGEDYKTILSKIWSTKRMIFPFYLTRDAQNFISRLLTKDPKKRLGYKDIDFIKRHSFFDTIDWNKLESRDPSLVPPIVPIITDPEKAENFSKEFTEMPLTPPAYDSALSGSKSENVPIPSRNNSDEKKEVELKHEGDQPFKGFSFTASQSFIDCAF